MHEFAPPSVQRSSAASGQALSRIAGASAAGCEMHCRSSRRSVPATFVACSPPKSCVEKRSLETRTRCVLLVLRTRIAPPMYGIVPVSPTIESARPSIVNPG
jgi:hypothetical protein